MEQYRVKTVVPLGKKKYKITLEGTEIVTLSLYPSEIRRYGISEEASVSDKVYKEIEELLYKRGKERALYHLKNSDKTVSQMRTKLREGCYPEDIIERIIQFLEKYNYVDDYRYTINYISYNKHRKSILRMRSDLLLKGIDKSVFDEAVTEAVSDEDNSEEMLIEGLCRKKLKPDMDDSQCNKIIMSLVRKGFNYEQVKGILRKVVEETSA